MTGTLSREAAVWLGVLVLGLFIVLLGTSVRRHGGVRRSFYAWPYGLWMLLFTVLPLLLISYYAFTDSSGRLTLDNFAGFWDSNAGMKRQLAEMGFDPAALGINDDDLKGLALSAALSTERLTTSPDYVFPMADWREREGSTFTLAGVRGEQVRAIPAPGLAAELCWTVAALARRLGKEIPARMSLETAVK